MSWRWRRPLLVSRGLELQPGCLFLTVLDSSRSTRRSAIDKRSQLIRAAVWRTLDRLHVGGFSFLNDGRVTNYG
jgi:hypothetical protein